jgi:hemolysin III
MREPRDRGRQTPGEEIANSLSHGLALLLAVIAAPSLIAAAANKGAAAVVGVSVYAATMLLLYLASAIYHALPPGRGKRVFQVLDHGAIYLFIAGSYTPFTLGVLRGPWGWTLFGLVWGLAILGVVWKAMGIRQGGLLSTGFYLLMGWLAVLAIGPLSAKIPVAGLLWLVAGGLAYSGGVAFYAARARYSHAVWHACVMGGSACHFVAVLRYAA